MTDLEKHIHTLTLFDTHEHLHKEARYVNEGPDIVQDLFDNYVAADLVVAGARQADVERLVDGSNPDLAARFAGVRDAWEKCQYTGYGEAVRWIARHVYSMDEITPESFGPAQERLEELRQPGERLRILRDHGNLDHVQVDDFCWACLPDSSGTDFFLYDLSWRSFCDGEVDPAAIESEVGVRVVNLESLRESMHAIFAKYAPCAIAVKAQHAYNRTLRWQERTDAEAGSVLEKVLSNRDVSEEELLCLGDWCWARGVELSIEHDLPFKLHTGSYGGHGFMPIDRIRAGNLCALLARYPEARFVLMHIAYPYNDELVAIAKHYPNVHVDLCWAWSLDPYSAGDFVRRMIHAVPINKLFAFGGDAFWPNATVAYAAQSRLWLTEALSKEVQDGHLTESQAIGIATRLMQKNQQECFDLDGTRSAIHKMAAVS